MDYKEMYSQNWESKSRDIHKIHKWQTELMESGSMYPYWNKNFWEHAHIHPSISTSYQNKGIPEKEIVKIKARVDT